MEPVLHRVAKPISVNEFKTVLDELCRPLYRNVHSSLPRRPILAVSGGADSMALAYLFSKVFATFPYLTIADHQVQQPCAVIVNHALREGSDEEAASVAKAINRMGFRSSVKHVNWAKQAQVIDPSKLHDIETRARYLRYNFIGKEAYMMRSTCVFLAHHEDDQYETVLMRAIRGHGYRGLQGMAAFANIPECYGVYRVHNSGVLEALHMDPAYLSFKPRAAQTKLLRKLFREARDTELLHMPFSSQEGLALDDFYFHPEEPDTRKSKGRDVPYLRPLDCEGGGVKIYRPLLGFGKDRLIATCEANNVPYVNDPSNFDPTLTLRNAVRHMVKHHALPEALQKPAILAMAGRARARVVREDAEAHRMIVRKHIIIDFDPNAGTLLVNIPTLVSQLRKRQRGLFGQARDQARTNHLRVVCAAVIRHLVEFVTPEENPPPLSNLDTVLHRLFPELNPQQPPPPPESVTVHGVLLEPVESPTSRKWFLSRSPYPSDQHLPERYMNWDHEGKPHIADFLAGKPIREIPPRENWDTLKAKQMELWDGRYWVNFKTCLALDLRIKPFDTAWVKPFREALPADQRAKLDKVLKHYAPGKVRTTLLALYHAEPDSTWPGLFLAPNRRPYQNLKLLALPTLDIQLPGLDQIFEYDVTYKKVNLELTRPGRRINKLPFKSYLKHPSNSRVRRNARLKGRQRGA